MSEIFSVFYIREKQGFDPAAAMLIHDFIEESSADFADYLPPNGFLVIFNHAGNGDARSKQYLDDLHGLLGRDERFATTRVGYAKGGLIVDIDQRGKFRGRPLGDAISRAMKDAEDS